jgi:hypothetical protein
LFRVGDTVTMRMNLVERTHADFLFGNDIASSAELLRILPCDVQHGGQRGVVSRVVNTTTQTFPECIFSDDSNYQFIDETMVEAHRVMKFLEYLVE